MFGVIVTSTFYPCCDRRGYKSCQGKKSISDARNFSELYGWNSEKRFLLSLSFCVFWYVSNMSHVHPHSLPTIYRCKLFNIAHVYSRTSYMQRGLNVIAAYRGVLFLGARAMNGLLRCTCFLPLYQHFPVVLYRICDYIVCPSTRWLATTCATSGERNGGGEIHCEVLCLISVHLVWYVKWENLLVSSDGTSLRYRRLQSLATRCAWPHMSL